MLMACRLDSLQKEHSYRALPLSGKGSGLLWNGQEDSDAKAEKSASGRQG